MSNTSSDHLTHPLDAPAPTLPERLCADLGLSLCQIGTARGPVELAMPAADPADEGMGRAILALHGGMGGWDQSLLLAVAALGQAEGFRLLALSRPGYLGTPLASGPGPVEQADLYAALLDRLGLARAVVIAVSAGGASALTFALSHPDRVEALILISTCTGRLRIPWRVRLALPMLRLGAWFPRLLAGRQRAGADPETVARRSIRDPLTVTRLLADPEARALFLALNATVSDRTAQRLPGTLADTRYFARMDDIAAHGLVSPVLVVHGDADRIVDVAQGLRLLREAPRAEGLIVKGGEHVALFTALAELRTRVTAFLSRLPAPQG